MQHFELFAIGRTLADTFVRAGVLVDDVLQRELAGRGGDADAEPLEPGRYRIQMGPAAEGTCGNSRRTKKSSG